MSKIQEYREKLSKLKAWEPFLMKNSGLPGPRGNLELAQAAAEMASKQQVDNWLRIAAEDAPENSARVFLVFCGVTALGKMAARGDRKQVGRLRPFASDERWRVREAAAIALQYLGDEDMPALLEAAQELSKGNCYEQRAAAAALAEPRLLKDPASAQEVLRLFDRITQRIASGALPKDAAFKVLRQGMAYCWSVAVASLPSEGKPLMEKWIASENADVRWIMTENLKKNRLAKMDAGWVKSMQSRSTNTRS